MIAPLENSIKFEAQTQPVPADLPLARVTLAAYDAMIEAGIVTNESRVELLDGQIVKKETIKPPHIFRLRQIFQRIDRQFDGRAVALSQSDIELPRDGRPQPDICLAHLDVSEQDYIRPPEVHLLIEVAETSIQTDRNYKQKLYARDEILEYWILNRNTKQLEVYRNPKDEHYRDVETFNAGEKVACLAFPNDLIDWS
jgi:Uma2 family endonuclease